MIEAVLTAEPRTPGAARLHAALKELEYEFIRLMRTRAYSLSVLGFPLMFYLLFGLDQPSGPAAQYVIAGYSCFALGSACLFGIGLGIAFERAQGWLELKWASPMPRLVYLAAKMAASAAFALIVMGMLIGLGVTAGNAHVSLTQAAELAGILLVGSIPFTALGLLVALIVPPKAAAGIINLVYIPISFASGFWMPLRMLPHWLKAAAPLLPTYHLGRLALGVFGLASGAHALEHWLVLAGFTVLMFAAAWITFVRSEAKSP